MADELCLLSVGRGDSHKVQEWFEATADNRNLSIYAALGTFDLVAIANQSGRPALEDLYRGLGLTRGRRGKGIGGWTRLYSCDLRPSVGSFDHNLPQELGTLVLTKRSESSPFPAAGNVNAAPEPVSWATDGYYSRALFVPSLPIDEENNAVVQEILRDRRSGARSHSIPLIRFATLLAPPDAILDSTVLDIQFLATSLPGRDDSAVTEISEILRKCIEPHDSTAELMWTQGTKDLITRSPVRVRLKSFLREMWALRRQQKSGILDTRCYLPVACTPHLNELLVPPSTVPSDLDGPWPLGPFTIEDVAGGRDWTSVLEGFRILEKEVRSARVLAHQDLANPATEPPAVDVHIRAIPRGSQPQTLYLSENTAASDKLPAPTIEISFPSSILELEKVRGVAALHEISQAHLRILLLGVKSLLQNPPLFGTELAPRRVDYNSPSDAVFNDIWRHLGEFVGTAIALTRQSLSLGRTPAIAQYAQLVWGTRPLATPEFVRLIGGTFLVELLSAAHSNEPRPTPAWIPVLQRTMLLVRGAQLELSAEARDYAAAIVSQPFALARDILLGHFLSLRRFNNYATDGYAIALSAAWCIACRFLRTLAPHIRRIL